MGLDVRQPEVTGTRWRGLVRALSGDVDLVVERVQRRLTLLPSYRPIPPDVLRPGIVATLGVILGEVLDGRDPAAGGAAHLAAFSQLGAMLARQGATASDLVQAWRSTREELIQRAREVLSPAPPTDPLLLQFIGYVLAWSDLGLVACMEGHRNVDLDRARREQHSRANLLRMAFSGGSTAEVARRAAAFSIDPTLRYHVVRARAEAGLDTEWVERCLVGLPPAPGMRGNGVVALVDDDVCGFVHRLPVDPVPVPAGVSRPVPLDDLADGFRMASRVLAAAVALGRTGLVGLDDLGVEAAVVADPEVGETLTARYVGPLAALGPPGDLVLDTVECYLANDGRLDSTARELHVHVNTVRYRLGRFEQVTDRSLRSNDVLVEVWWALRYRALTRGEVIRL